MNSNIFRDVTPCSLVEYHWHVGGMHCLVACLAYFSTLKMEAAYSSEMSGVDGNNNKTLCYTQYDADVQYFNGKLLGL
jgi:hypothetical protein